MHWKALTLTLFLSTLALAGCIGEDTTPTPDDDTDNQQAAATDETGAIKGKVFDVDLQKVPDATVALTSGTELIEDTRTDAEGQYVFNGVAPGNYRIQVSAICCKNAVKSLDVTAGAIQTVDFSIERLTANDLQEPYVHSEEWQGFVACGVGTLAVSWATCSTLDDPNDDFMLEFNVSKGIKSFSFGMDWEPVGGVSGQEFSILLENNDCDVVDCSYTYADLDGPPPHTITISNDDITDDEWKWDEIEGERTLQFRVFPSGDATAVYQQPFSVHYHGFYWEEAPESFSPLPDS